METYWDLSRLERAALDNDKLEMYIDIQLMQDGMCRPIEPAYETVTEDAPLDTVPYWIVKPGKYGSSSLAFDSLESAENFVRTFKVFCVTHDYGSDLYTAELTDVVIETVRVVDSGTVERDNASRVANRRVKADNKRKREEFNRANDVVEAAVRNIYEDRADACMYAKSVTQTKTTFAEYIEMTDGDKTLAFQFLCKAFPDKELVEDATGLDYMEHATVEKADGVPTQIDSDSPAF